MSFQLHQLWTHVQSHVFYLMCHFYPISSCLTTGKTPGNLLKTQSSGAKRGLGNGAAFLARSSNCHRARLRQPSKQREMRGWRERLCCFLLDGLEDEGNEGEISVQRFWFDTSPGSAVKRVGGKEGARHKTGATFYWTGETEWWSYLSMERIWHKLLV